MIGNNPLKWWAGVCERRKLLQGTDAKSLFVLAA